MPQNSTSDHLYSLSNRGQYSELIKYLRNHDNKSVRYGAAGVLAESTNFVENATPEVKKELIDSVLSDPSDQVRAKVLDLLYHIDETIFDNIITRLELSPDTIPENSPYPLILNKWLSSNKYSLRLLAVVGYGQVGGQSGTTKIGTVLIEETDIRVLIRAIEVAGEIGDKKFVSSIQNYLRVDESEVDIAATSNQLIELKHTAIDGLIKIGSDAAYEALVSATRSTDEELRQHAISEIGRFGAQETVDMIVNELDNKDNDELREEAAEGVITNFEESEFEDSADVRQQAIELIAEDVSNDVSEEFASIIQESENDSEKRNAAWLLGQVDDRSDDAIESLIESLDADDRYLRKIAAGSLTNMDDNKVERRIERYLSTVDDGDDTDNITTFLETHLEGGAEEAKKDAVDYTYVTDPTDYTTSRPSGDG